MAIVGNLGILKNYEHKIRMLIEIIVKLFRNWNWNWNFVAHASLSSSDIRLFINIEI